jgi:O-antigen/teichoic acid export membrane protein
MAAGTETVLRRLSLRQNFSWAVAGRIVFVICQWGMLALLAKLSTTSVVGAFTLALAINAPIFRLAHFGLRVAQVTDVQSRFDFADYMGLRTLAGLLGMVVATAIAVVFYAGSEIATVIVLVGASKLVDSVCDLLYAVFQKRDRMDYVARSLFIRGPVALAAVGAGIVLTGQLAVGIAAQAVLWALVCAFHDIPLTRRTLREELAVGGVSEQHARIRPRYDRRTLLRLAWEALPLAMVGMLLSFQATIPRYFVAELGLEALGYFAALVYVLKAVNELIISVGHSAIARLSRLYAEGQMRRFAALLAQLIGLGVVAGTLGLGVVAVAGEEILTLLYSEEYAAYADLFFWVMAAAIVRYAAKLLRFGIVAARRFRLELLLTVIGTGATLLISAWFIGEWGLRGAAFIPLASYSVDLVVVLGLNIWSIQQRRSQR